MQTLGLLALTERRRMHRPLGWERGQRDSMAIFVNNFAPAGQGLTIRSLDTPAAKLSTGNVLVDHIQ
jgi:hypothetical protein